MIFADNKNQQMFTGFSRSRTRDTRRLLVERSAAAAVVRKRFAGGHPSLSDMIRWRAALRQQVGPTLTGLFDRVKIKCRNFFFQQN